jgi:DGQHR domain-containing protein
MAKGHRTPGAPSKMDIPPRVLPKKLHLTVIKAKVLGVDVYRGFAKLCDLTNISQADVFDQTHNPLGTQRDLNEKHAKEAYAYVRDNELAFWPEVFLCVREPRVASFIASQDTGMVGVLTIDTQVVKKSSKIFISRVDGNHRLHYAGGNEPGFPSITKEVSFCLAYNLTLEQEIRLFRDINNNQRRMNTSHLDNIDARLAQDEVRKNPPLYMAKRLNKDAESPFFERIFEGGAKPAYFAIPLRAMKSGIAYMLSQPSKLSGLPDMDAQYVVIRNYFCAVKKWQPEAWAEPRKYLLLRGAGLWAVCFIGADVIHRTLDAGKFETKDMLSILESGPKWDWSNKGNFQGYSGRGGAAKIRDTVVAKFEDKSGISLHKLASQILMR